jgi:hypothetical protein
LNDNPNRRNTFAENVNPWDALLPENHHKRSYRILEQPMELNQEFLFRVAIASIVQYVYVHRRLNKQMHFPHGECAYIRDYIDIQYAHLIFMDNFHDSMRNLIEYEQNIIEMIQSNFIEVEKGRAFRDSLLGSQLTLDNIYHIVQLSDNSLDDQDIYDIRQLTLSQREIIARVPYFKIMTYYLH